MSKFFYNLTIRSRLTLVFSGVVCLALIIFSLAVYRSVVNSLENEIDQDIEQRGTEVSHYVASINTFTERDLQEIASYFTGVKLTPDPGASIVNSDRGGTFATSRYDLTQALSYVQISDTQGHPLKAVPDLRLMSLPENQALLKEVLTGKARFDSIRLIPTGEQVRVYSQPILQRGNLVGYVQSIRSLQDISTISSNLALPFILTAILAVAGLAITGWWITRKAFSPVYKITDAAYRIGINNGLNERIEVDPQSNDEVSRLGRAFNSMLDRIEKEFKAQRQFVADSSHELRTPLTVIRGNLDLLKRNPDPQNQAESLQAIEREATRMQSLVQDLLLLAQADARKAIELVPTSLDEVVLEVYMQSQVLVKAHKQTLKLGHFDVAMVNGNADQLKRAFLNLVDNAIKYTPDEGSISVALYSGKRWTRVVVQDNGVGINATDQQRIFDRFYRVDKARSRGSGGTGLGLPIVKHIVEGHGGRITVESEPGKGATFTVWLPMLEGPELQSDEDENGELTSPFETEKSAPTKV